MTSYSGTIDGSLAAAKETAAESGPDPFDLRPQRDLVMRRVSRERMRRALRVATLLAGETLVVAGVLALALVAVPGGQQAFARWSYLLPLVLLCGIAGQAAAHTYGPAAERRSYLRSASAAVGSVLSFVLIGWLYSEFRLAGGEVLVLGVGLAVGYAAVRLAVEHLIRRIYLRDMGRRPTLILGDPEAAWRIRTQLMVSDDRQARVLGHLSQ